MPDDEDSYEVALSPLSRALATHAYRNVLKEKSLGTYRQARSHGEILAQAQDSVLTKKLTMGREALCQSARHRRDNALRNYVETKAELDYWDIEHFQDTGSATATPDAQEAKQAPPSPARKPSFLPDISKGKGRPNPLRSTPQLPSLTPLKIPPTLTTRSTANSPVLAIFGRWKHYDEMVSEGDKIFMDLTAIRQERRLAPLQPLPLIPACRSALSCHLPSALSSQFLSCPLPGTNLPSPLRKSDNAENKAKKTLGWKQIEEEMQQVERALKKIRSQSMSHRDGSPCIETNDPDAQMRKGVHKPSSLPQQSQADDSAASSTQKVLGPKTRRAASSLASLPAISGVLGRSPALGDTALPDRMCWSSLALTQPLNLAGSHAAVDCQ